ncbi:MAG: hypothetical protein PHU63_03790, partial [Candidatus ainarchaeum sp.]|nr:hypothetical protein [Candidatus ainarchaeum sp.]
MSEVQTAKKKDMRSSAGSRLFQMKGQFRLGTDGRRPLIDRLGGDGPGKQAAELESGRSSGSGRIVQVEVLPWNERAPDERGFYWVEKPLPTTNDITQTMMLLMDDGYDSNMSKAAPRAGAVSHYTAIQTGFEQMFHSLDITKLTDLATGTGQILIKVLELVRADILRMARGDIPVRRIELIGVDFLPSLLARARAKVELRLRELVHIDGGKEL